MGVFRMPSLGADMDSGRLVEWLVAPGDTVKRGDVIAVVDTAKAAIDVEVFETGVVSELLVEPGVEVAVGTPLATIDGAAAPEPPDKDSGPRAEPAAPAEPQPAAPDSSAAKPPLRHLAHQLGVELTTLTGTGPDGEVTRQDILAAAEPPAAQAAPPKAPGPTEAPPSAGGRQRARVTPRARRLAQERGVELAEVSGSGAAGAVTGADVETHHPVDSEPARSGKPTEVSAGVRSGDERKEAMRAATATLMGRSAREIPHYYVSATLDVGHVLDWLSRHNSPLAPRDRVIPAALFLRAVVLAAEQVPELNGHWVDGAFVPVNGVNLGVAVGTRGGGLVTPAIVDAGRLSLDELMGHLSALVRRARTGKLRSGEMQPGSITVSSLADGGPDALFGVIYPPQVALVGVGGIADRPQAVDGMLTVRPTVTVTLAADHRATDGRTGARFLDVVSEALTQPEEL